MYPNVKKCLLIHIRIKYSRKRVPKINNVVINKSIINENNSYSIALSSLAFPLLQATVFSFTMVNVSCYKVKYYLNTNFYSDFIRMLTLVGILFV